MKDDDSLLRSFVTIKPAAEKILSDGTDVTGYKVLIDLTSLINIENAFIYTSSLQESGANERFKVHMR
jgi:hypothetical protein